MKWEVAEVISLSVGPAIQNNIILRISAINGLTYNLTGDGFLISITESAVPVPPAVWLFVSGFIGLVLIRTTEFLLLKRGEEEMTNKKRNKWVLVFVLIGMILPINLFAAAYSFTTIDYPGQAYPNLWWAGIGGINNSGNIVGNYYDESVIRHAYAYDGNAFTPIDYPGSTRTGAGAINDMGTMAGVYTDSAEVKHMYLYDGATWDTIDHPESPEVLSAVDINNSGIIVGQYGWPGIVTHAFLYDGVNFNIIDNPGSPWNSANGINEAGNVVGFDTIGGLARGYFLDGSIYTTIIYPGASGGTYLSGINNYNSIAGKYQDTNGWNSFLYDGENFIDIVYPGASQTMVNDINDLGQIVGSYMDKDGISHGFIANPVPLPGAIWLLGSGIIGLIRVRKTYNY